MVWRIVLVEVAGRRGLMLSERSGRVSVVRRPQVNRRGKQGIERRIGRVLDVVRRVVLRRRLHLDLDSRDVVVLIVVADAALVAKIRTAVCKLMVVRQRDRIGVRRVDRPRVS